MEFKLSNLRYFGKEYNLDHLNKIDEQIVLIKSQANELSQVIQPQINSFEKSNEISTSVKDRLNKIYGNYILNLLDYKKQVDKLEEEKKYILGLNHIQKSLFSEIIKSYRNKELKDDKGEIIENFQKALDIAFEKSHLDREIFNKSIVTLVKGYKEGSVSKEMLEKAKESLIGGLADGKTLQDIAKKHKVDLKEIENQYKKGLKVEKEHSKDKKKIEEIVKDHLMENPIYYDKLETIEKSESVEIIDVELKKEPKELKKYSDAIIKNQDNKILFLLRNKESVFEANKFCLPGGHIDPNELPEQAVVREVKEEVGLTVVLNEELAESKNPEIHYFECMVEEPNEIVLNNEEHVNYKWMNKEEYEKEDLILNLKENLNKIFDSNYKVKKV